MNIRRIKNLNAEIAFMYHQGKFGTPQNNAVELFLFDDSAAGFNQLLLLLGYENSVFQFRKNSGVYNILFRFSGNV